MTHETPFILAGEPRSAVESVEVRSPYDSSLVAEVASPSDEDVEAALRKSAEAYERTRTLPIHVRAEALMHVSRRMEERVHEAGELIAREGGKPMRWALVEARRAASTFRWAAEEIRQGTGMLQRLDTESGMEGRLGVIRRFPYGPVLGITPFNFPMNLVAHKVAPAIAVGAPIIVKPATQTPLGALFLASLVSETELPGGIHSVLPVAGSRAEPLVTDSRIKKVSFTGSGSVGWRLKGLDPRKRFTLELGGNAGVIVHGDADLDYAAERIAYGGYYQAGQSCISVQRVFVQHEVYEDFAERFVKHVEALITGDPLDPATDVGPVIDSGALERIEEWVAEAVAGGAEILTGGERNDPFYQPTVLSETTPEMKVRCEEIFGPVTTLTRYETWEEAIDEVNDSSYGLQAGLFTSSIDRAFQAHRDLQVGGVIVNDQSAFRADQMPYGGTKESGYGREGLRYAIEDMTEPRIMVLRVPL